jgi:predicted RNA-binding Zn ribbon-like protein
MPASTARAARQPQISAAPGELELVRAFVNSRDIEEGTDELASTAGLEGWLARAGLAAADAADGVALPAAADGVAPGAAPAARVTPADLEQAVALRESLRGILRSHQPAADGRGRLSESTADLRRAAAALPVRLEIGGDGTVASVPAGSGAAAAMARLLLIAAESAVLGTWARLKACGADDCQWAFYDRSPTQSGCWCSMQICGGRAKSRAYRQRAGRAARPRRSRA